MATCHLSHLWESAFTFKSESTKKVRKKKWWMFLERKQNRVYFGALKSQGVNSVRCNQQSGCSVSDITNSWTTCDYFLCCVWNTIQLIWASQGHWLERVKNIYDLKPSVFVNVLKFSAIWTHTEPSDLLTKIHPNQLLCSQVLKLTHLSFAGTGAHSPKAI